MTPPKIFISYSWDSPDHQAWVLRLANHLVNNGVDVVLDQYELKLGANLTHFMEQAVTKVDKVLLILTENYKIKAEERQGGVGYEYSIINAEWYRQQASNTKFIPILRGKDTATSMPVFVHAFVYLSMQDDSQFEAQVEDLLRAIYKQPKVVKPPLGKRPIFTQPKATAAQDSDVPPSSDSNSQELEEQIKALQQQLAEQQAALDKNTSSNLGKTEKSIKEKRLSQQQDKLKQGQAALIRELISKNETQKAITALQQIAEEQHKSDLETELTLLSARFQRYLKEKRMGLSSSEQQGLSAAQINHAVLELIALL